MSPRARSPRTIGIVVAIALVAVAIGAYALLGRGDGHYRVTAYFPRAVSVFESSDVRVLGLPAGTVTGVDIDGERVKVTMSIEDDIPLPEDLHAQLVPQSLIGERYVELFPAWVQGTERAADGHVIEEDDTVTPVEPDEALAAVKRFLDSLDPKGLGRLIDNLESDLHGNGPALNDMLSSLSDVVSTFAEKDEALGRIVDSFDRLTATLATREQQLGQVIDAFGQATQVLADERQGIEQLVRGLAQVSKNGLQLVSEHATDLRSDIQTLTDAAASIDANLSAVDQLLTSGPLLAKGLVDAFDPASRSINLRNSFSPLIPEILALLTGPLGIPSMCLQTVGACDATATGQSDGAATAATITADSPIGSLLALLDGPTQAPVRHQRSWWERAGHHARGAADALLGTGS